MEVLINTIPLFSLTTGVGKYTFYTAKTLREIDKKNSYTYFYGYYSKNLIIPKADFFRRGFQKIKDIISHTPFAPFLRNMRGSLAGLQSMDFDIYFEPNFILLEKIKAKKRIVSVFDFSFEKYPDWHPKDRIEYFRENFWKTMNNADKIIVPSQFIFNQAVSEYGFNEEILKTVYPGVDFEIFKEYPQEMTESLSEKYHLPDRFILYVGSIEPRKNLKNLLFAYQFLPQYLRKDIKLVLAGFSGWKNREIMEIIENDKNIIYIGYISERELALLYSKASLFVFPSFYEGFGLPPLEAMACGCPVLVSNRASLPEVCGDAAFYCEPEKPESIAEAICKVLEYEDIRKKLIIKGKDRVKFFHWDKTAREILNIFEEVRVG